MIPRIITPTTVTVHFDGEILVANENNPNFSEIRKAAQAQEWETVQKLCNIGKAVEAWSDGEFLIKDGSVFYMDQRIPLAIEKRILGFLEEGAPFEHLLAFYRNLENNPSRRSVQELYAFLEHESIPIGEDGCFYAYKSVRHSWMDWHSNSCSNTIGTTLSMARNQVDDDANRGCSYGYHVGSLKYASSFGGSTTARLLIVKVNPKNVVSVPHDCAHQKVRTSEYTVVCEYTGPLPEVFWNPDASSDDGVFPESDNSNLEDDELLLELESLEDQIADSEEKIKRLQTAVDAALDADLPEAWIHAHDALLLEAEDELGDLQSLRDFKEMLAEQLGLK